MFSAVRREDEIKAICLEVAGVLKELRESLGLSKNALSQQAGVAVQTVAFLESGTNIPSLATLIRICDALGSSVDKVYRQGLERIQKRG